MRILVFFKNNYLFFAELLLNLLEIKGPKRPQEIFANLAFYQKSAKIFRKTFLLIQGLFFIKSLLKFLKQICGFKVFI